MGLPGALYEEGIGMKKYAVLFLLTFSGSAQAQPVLHEQLNRELSMAFEKMDRICDPTGTSGATAEWTRCMKPYNDWASMRLQQIYPADSAPVAPPPTMLNPMALAGLCIAQGRPVDDCMVRANGVGGDNNCQYEWQTAADGSRCGARAAMVRPGGYGSLGDIE